MDSNQAIELEKWEIKDLTAENAVKWLVSASFVSGHTAMFGLANFIKQQEKTITDLQARLRELDEKNQTQAHCLAARDWIIKRQESDQAEKCETCFANYAKVTGKMTERAEAAEAKVERQERMVKNAIDYIQDQNGDCPLNAGCNCVEDDMCTGPCPLDGSDEQAEKCWRRWLEQEAGK